MRFLDVLGPNNQAHLINSEVRSRATSIVSLYERVYVGRFECAFRQFRHLDVIRGLLLTRNERVLVTGWLLGGGGPLARSVEVDLVVPFGGWQRSLLDPLAVCILRPPTTRWDGNAVPGA